MTMDFKTIMSYIQQCGSRMGSRGKELFSQSGRVEESFTMKGVRVSHEEKCDEREWTRIVSGTIKGRVKKIRLERQEM